MVALAEWFEANEIPFTLLDLDTGNKTRGSLKHFFNGSVAKVKIHTPAQFHPCFCQDGDSSVASRLDYQGSRFESS